MATTTIEQRPALKLAWAPIIWIGGLHVGALLAFVPGWFSWSGLALCLLLHWMTGGIGICMTYHRLLTHRSFALRPRWLEYLFTIIGTCASEGGPIGWVADHRRHHANSDEENDTHTPARGILLGSHGLVDDSTTRRPSIRPSIIRSGRRTSIATPSIDGSTPTTSSSRSSLFAGLYAAGGMSWLVWGGFVRTVFVLHSTWLVNSATHLWGYRSHSTRDDSTNLWWVALLTYGEGWHNNHHAYQTSARHGLRWWEFDMTYITIWTMKVCRIAYNIKLVKLAAARVPAMATRRRASAD